MKLSGWGRYPRVNSEVVEPPNTDTLLQMLAANKSQDPVIARGAGRSYGDSALSDRVVSSRFLDSFIALDEARQTMRCGAGVTLEEILKVALPKGWFLPVVPGTRFVSVGGAIAADIHGKNHHLHGTFCKHITALTLALASGETRHCSPGENSELFYATCGGMGLTGIILDATVSFEKISTTFIKRHSLAAPNLDACFELMQEHDKSRYSVAWIDCLAKNENLGRSILQLGEHVQGDAEGKGEGEGEGAGEEKSPLLYKTRRGLSVPFSTPALLLNRFTMSAFNGAYYHMGVRGAGERRVNYDSFFFPLDNIRNWNRLYGRKGFLQYQLVIPTDAAAVGIKKILQMVAESGRGSFLAVLKKFGEANNNLLSFPTAGYTLALDFKRQKALFPLLDELDKLVLDHGGRLYLAKDARMSEAMFRACYPDWERFMEIRQQVDPAGRFSSLQSRRLGLG